MVHLLRCAINGENSKDVESIAKEFECSTRTVYREQREILKVIEQETNDKFPRLWNILTFLLFV